MDLPILGFAGQFSDKIFPFLFDEIFCQYCYMLSRRLFLIGPRAVGDASSQAAKFWLKEETSSDIPSKKTKN